MSTRRCVTSPPPMLRPRVNGHRVAWPEPRTLVAAPAADGRGRHVLLVEDDAAVRAATALLLRIWGFRVAEAVQRAREHADLDFVIADLHLDSPGTGFDAIAAVRAQLGDRVGAVLVTGDTAFLASERARTGDTLVASKPVDPELILGLLRA